MIMKEVRMIKVKKLTLGLPFKLGSCELEPNDVEQRTAWTLYVELMTRVAVQPLDPEHGILREVLDSLYTIFKLTRDILKDAGPGVAKGPASLGPIAIAVLNQGLRPFTAKWHPRLKDYEAKRAGDVSQVAHEHAWELAQEMRQDLAQTQEELKIYADVLALIAGAKE
jgi:hypothetical protein